ncbi:MAG TPA: DPP IV N-terminal domain-containing protein [Thermoanaerobaculia bacterium]|nr:DPP IV N-terminal domain-containing protein [Thermoanaerobaculia bacterium]
MNVPAPAVLLCLALALPLPAAAAASAARSPVPPVPRPTTSPPAAPSAAASKQSGPDPTFLEQYTRTLRFTLGTPQSIHVAPGGGPVLFLRSAPRSFVRDLYEHDVATGQERLLASAEKLLGGGEERLSPEEKARRERARLTARGIASYDLSEDGQRVLVPLSARRFVVERATGAIRELPAGDGFPLDPRFSPDGAQVACVRNGDLYVSDVATGAERRLTTGATPTLSHGLAEFVAQEEMGRREGYWWSPNSKTIAYEESDTSRVELFHIADPMHPENPADSWPYPRPGKNNAEVRLGLVPAAGGATAWVDWDRKSYPYLAQVRWKKEGPLTLLVQNREQTEQRLLAVDPATGATRPLLDEHDAAWLNLHASIPLWLADGSGFLWISERTGEPRLELRGADGSARRWLTPEGFGLQALLEVIPEGGAGGAAYVEASADPTQMHLWRVPLRSGTPAALTREPGLHGAVFARDASAAVWSEALLSGERFWSVRHRDGSEAGRLRSAAEQPPFFPRPELTTLGPLLFHAAIIRPRDFQPGRKYPVLVSVYGGPKAQTVHSSPWSYLLDQWIADHGFVVITLDGRGTPGRGGSWERVIKGNLIDLQLADQVAGLQAAGAKYPELDLARAGIYGWSFGGYFSAMAAMRRPDVYRAAVAGAPVCDWQDYDTHYTERYLGLPQTNPEGYRKSSVLTYCPDLRVPLLIVHGTADDNVYFTHSLKMTDALFRARRKYDFLVLPGFTHMVPDPVVQTALQERIIAFFTAHLAL